MTQPLRVSLDVTAVPARPAGAGRYVFEFAKGLSRSTEVQVTDAGRTWKLTGSQR